MLRVAPCTSEAAKYAVEHWHYSRLMPRFRLVKFGVWEDDRFIGAVIYGRGATPELGKPYGLRQVEFCELTRVALTGHRTPTTQIVASTLDQLKVGSPGTRLVISFADEQQGHLGIIYQAGNWIYLGPSMTHGYRVKGQMWHPKTLHSRYGIGGQSIPWLQEHVDPVAARVMLPPKHRYAYPLDRAMRRRLQPLALPYPRGSSLDGEMSGLRSDGPGSTPGDRSR